MSEVKEFVELEGPEKLGEAVLLCPEVPMVVVRNAISQEALTKITCEMQQKSGNTRLNWRDKKLLFNLVPEIKLVGEASRKWLKSQPGLTGRLNHTNPHLLRNGGIDSHIDNQHITLSASLNLSNGDGDNPTTFYARRLTDADVKHKRIREIWSSQESEAFKRNEGAELSEGDIVIISRGVLHAVNANHDRQAIIMPTMSLYRAS